MIEHERMDEARLAAQMEAEGLFGDADFDELHDEAEPVEVEFEFDLTDEELDPAGD